MFAEHFALRAPALINFVGGGGKTSLILRLLDELCHPGPVIYTTTTRIHPPRPSDGMMVISSDNRDILTCILQRLGRMCADRTCKLVVTGPSAGERFLKGVGPEFASSINRADFPFILNEADGARSMSLKMPREGEPVLMEGAQYLVPVIGADCLMKTLGPETLFRWELVSDLFSPLAGKPITPEVASGILLHPRGVCKGWRKGVRIVPFINKVDNDTLDKPARELALALLNNPNLPVERVVWGSLLCGRAGSLSSRTL